MLENWRNFTLCGAFGDCMHRWIGSQVMLWAPETMSQWSNYPSWVYWYPPNRDQQFDTRFQHSDSLPPATPVVGQVLRASFREMY
jgi:hypothetical protein